MNALEIEIRREGPGSCPLQSRSHRRTPPEKRMDVNLPQPWDLAVRLEIFWRRSGSCYPIAVLPALPAKAP
jgi:hypothetical protein